MLMIYSYKDEKGKINGKILVYVQYITCCTDKH